MQTNRIRLGVNIDHVATLRNARGEMYPSLGQAALTSIENGADQITIHLREDRRHIIDGDVPLIRKITKESGRLMNFEMGANDDILRVAIRNRPDWVCLVPEKREEKTTEGGLDLNNSDVYKKLLFTCERLKKEIPTVKISLFLEASQNILSLLPKFPIDAVEIHTGDFARDFIQNKPFEKHIVQFQTAKSLLEEMDLGVHAGHGLTQESLRPLLQKNLFVEYNIGHWIICESVFKGLANVVQSLRGIMDENY